MNASTKIVSLFLLMGF